LEFAALGRAFAPVVALRGKVAAFGVGRGAVGGLGRFLAVGAVAVVGTAVVAAVIVAAVIVAAVIVAVVGAGIAWRVGIAAGAGVEVAAEAGRGAHGGGALVRAHRAGAVGGVVTAAVVVGARSVVAAVVATVVVGSAAGGGGNAQGAFGGLETCGRTRRLAVVAAVEVGGARGFGTLGVGFVEFPGVLVGGTFWLGSDFGGWLGAGFGAGITFFHRTPPLAGAQGQGSGVPRAVLSPRVLAVARVRFGKRLVRRLAERLALRRVGGRLRRVVFRLAGHFAWF
jgi:hypothetical protein